jgi:hypothetical protein
MRAFFPGFRDLAPDACGVGLVLLVGVEKICSGGDAPW